MAKEVWHCFFGRVEDYQQTTVINLLSAAGVRTFPYDSEDFYKMGDCSAGIVFFDRADAGLLDFLQEVSRQGLRRIIAVSIGNNLSSKELWGLLQCGASDAFSLEHSPQVGEEIAARLKHWKNIDEILVSPLVESNIIGKSPGWIKTLRQIIGVARFTDASVLITGETGTGKELIARLIHTLDAKRRQNSLIVLDCTTIVPELSGSEFFGHERGAFTGSVARRDGAFALADRGTLFLDEVGELPLALQAELLRVVQEHTYKPVGSNNWQKTNFRLICATNRNLLEQEERGNFRRDFYHRLSTWTCHLPPLRSRVEDIPLLAEHFLTVICDGKQPPALDEAVSEYLIQREYPGNVRELYQLIKRIACRHVGRGPITLGDIPESDRPGDIDNLGEWRDAQFEQSIRRAILLGIRLKEITDATERTAEMIAIALADGKVSNAAERLGIDKRTLQIHVKEYREKLKNLIKNETF